MFKPETLRKMMKRYNEMYQHYMEMPLDELAKIFSISQGNTKIGHVLNVSLMPIVTCANCKECMYICYDVKACVGPNWETVLNARAKNTALMHRDLDLYMKLIDLKMTRRRKNKYFRWHVAGDITSEKYFDYMVKLAGKHPDFKIWTYTKNYSLVNEYVRTHGNDRHAAIPSNFIIMFSEWDGLKMDNPYNFPIFTCRLKDGNKNHNDDFFKSLYKCTGNCDLCKATKRGCIVGEDTYADEH